MAVKVMLAPVISSSSSAPSAVRSPAKKSAPRPRRRRSSVYDAEGHEVFITLMCLKCGKIRPLSQFGLRRMADGAIRNQPWCRSCRSAPAAKGEKANRKGSPAPGESPITQEPQPSAAKAPETRRSGSVATEVAAALAGGRS
ncbi:MAG TPA: hypothetical protein VFG59_17855 [Anaeromyxobacter sp.]|nr:hypothetical protein [Anaeromyxobacter sp.]